MKNQDFVSVIVPCYNYGHFLEETVSSVLNQTHKNLECLVIDDGSQDNTEEIARKLEQKDSRVKYFYQENQGLSAARNTGIQKSNGQFIQFLDADDLITKEKLSKQLETLIKSEEIDIVYGDAFYFDSDQPSIIYKDFLKKNKEWMPKVSGPGNIVLNELIKGNIMVVSAPLIKKSLFNKLGGFDINLKSYEDWDFWMRAAESNFYFHYLPGAESRTLIRLHNSSMTTNGTKMLDALVHLYNKHQVLLPSEKNLNKFFNRKFKKTFINLVAYYRTEKQMLKNFYTMLPFTKAEQFLLDSKRNDLNFILLKVYSKLL